MKSRATERFWKCYEGLPPEVRGLAREAHEAFQKDPHYPSLHFKRIHGGRSIYSVRISLDYRAVGIVEDDEITWFWIGSHAEYDRLIRRMRNA